MLERVVCIPRNLAGEPFDIGSLAELLLYFGKVEVVLGPGYLSELVSRIGWENLLQLQDSGLISVRVLREVLAVRGPRPGRPYFDFGTVELTGDASFKAVREQSARELITKALRRADVSEGRIKRRLDRFFRYGSVESVNEAVLDPSGLPGMSRRDLEDPGYVSSVVRAVLEIFGYVHRHGEVDFRVNLLPAGGFTIDTNIDFAQLSRDVSATFGADRGINAAILIGMVQEARLDIQRAAIHSADIAGSDLSVRLARARVHRDLASIHPRSLGQIVQLQEHALQGRSVGEAVRSGRRSADDLLRLLERAGRFKEWLAGRPPDADLLREYVNALSAQPWLSTLPAKTLRFGLTVVIPTAVAARYGPEAGSAVGIGVSAINDFIVDRLAQGWRPNQFVCDELEPFCR